MLEPRSVAQLVADPERLTALAELEILDTPAEGGFDDIVQLAVHLCDVPVGLVSLVASDRQWFKARVGFPPCETDLESSVCAHALAEPDLLVIPDLSVDPRTRLNPLVTGEPYIRFYAGAPLHAGSGQPLGSLCVIDHHARPAGLTVGQADGLRALGRQLCRELELRRLLMEREAHLREQQRTRDLLQTVTDHVGQAIFHLDGDGRVIFSNPAAAKMFGFSADEMLGRRLHDLVHHSRPDGSPFPASECELRHALIDGELLEESRQLFFRKDGSPRDVMVTNAPVLTGGNVKSAVVTVVDVTERLRVEQALAAGNHRRAALAQLGDHLRTTMSVDAISYTASAIVGRMLEASQTAYAAVDPARGTVLIDTTWNAPGFSSLAGHYRLGDYGTYSEDLKAGRTVIVADVLTDKRTCDHVGAFRALGIAAFINVPVVEQGELVGLFLAVFEAPRKILREEEDFVRAAADRTRAGIGRLRAEEQQSILNNEISHRLKNSMAMIQAIANQTFKGLADRGPVQAFETRLMALSTAHDVLLQKDWNAADLEEVLHRVLDAAGADGRYDAGGPPVTLGPRAALSTTLLLHELATNASKYGSLTVPAGRIVIEWGFTGGKGSDELVLSWCEVGGPATAAPERQGFGSKLLRLGLTGTGGSRLEYAASGLTATFRASRKQVEQS